MASSRLSHARPEARLGFGNAKVSLCLISRQRGVRLNKSFAGVDDREQSNIVHNPLPHSVRAVPHFIIIQRISYKQIEGNNEQSCC